jgi:hypothetical protein
VPPASDEVVNVATPPAESWATGLLIRLPLSKKLTFPVGVPPVLVTVAVKVTGCPKTLGLGEDDPTVVVVGVKIFSDSGCEVLERKLGSPLYVAVIG